MPTHVIGVARAVLPLVLLAANAVSVADDEPVPELGLFEFLGEFEDADGVWIDPLDLDPENEPDASRPVTATGTDQEESER